MREYRSTVRLKPDLKITIRAGAAAAKAGIENDTRKCYPEFDLASKVGGA